MQADREQLRSLDEPGVPMDFVAALEPQLARSMLIDGPDAESSAPSYQPGAYRRKHQRRFRREHRRHRLTRFAVAALVLVALSAGLWATITLVPFGSGGGEGERLVNNDTALPPDDALAVATPAPSSVATPDADTPLAADEVVHHRLPMPAPTRLANAVPDAATEPITVETGFALVIHADDAADVETVFSRVLAELAGEATATAAPAPDSVALVRNFTHDEARRLLRQWSAGTSAPGAPVVSGVADLSPEAVERQLPKWRGELDRQRETSSEHLLGPRDIAPDWERQLDLSARGATHTIVVPESRLAEFLSRLRLAEGQQTFLRPLPVKGDASGDDVPADDATMRRWVKDFQLVRDFIAKLDEATGREHQEASVVLPVVIETR
ncbi:MAG: hypothetical protein ACYTGP_11180 [Planctomycetota bacterium]|jgi:hypothetical protein